MANENISFVTIHSMSKNIVAHLFICDIIQRDLVLNSAFILSCTAAYRPSMNSDDKTKSSPIPIPVIR